MARAARHGRPLVYVCHVAHHLRLPARAVHISLVDRHPHGRKPIRGSAERRVSAAQ